jgi:hypothetical protein
MSREIADPPHPTPNPDGPYTPAKNHESTPVPAGPPPEAEAAQEEPYDSFFDDLNKKLTQSIEQPAPDPVLGPETPEGGSSKHTRPDDPLARVFRTQKLSPRTSEVFKAVVALSTGQFEPTPAAPEVPPGFLQGDSPDPESPVVARSDSPLLTDLVVEQREVEQQPIAEDDTLDEPSFPWFQVLILSYASAVTVALAWAVLTGRSFRPSDRSSTGSISSSDLRPRAKSNGARVDGKALAPVPAENLTTLGSALRIGDLQVRPMSVALARIELVGALDQSKYRAEESESLVLRVQLTNFSKTQPFAPLELAYIREQSSPLDRCLITTTSSTTIGAFPLDVFSEWSIVGQESRVLKRGETLETIIASEPGASDRMSSEMIWRIRLRTGPFRTDVIGVRFKDSDVERDPSVCAAPR